MLALRVLIPAIKRKSMHGPRTHLFRLKNIQGTKVVVQNSLATAADGVVVETHLMAVAEIDDLPHCWFVRLQLLWQNE